MIRNVQTLRKAQEHPEVYIKTFFEKIKYESKNCVLFYFGRKFQGDTSQVRTPLSSRSPCLPVLTRGAAGSAENFSLRNLSSELS